MMKTAYYLIKQTINEWIEDGAARLGAALAFYIIFSLAPILLIVTAIAGYFYDEVTAREALLAQLHSLIGYDGVVMVRQMMNHAWREDAGLVATLVGVSTILFGASGVFAELQQSLNAVWGAPAPQGSGIVDFIRRRLLSFTIILGTGFLLLVSLVLSTVLAFVEERFLVILPAAGLLLRLLNLSLSFTVVMLLFAMIFKILPDVTVRWRDVWAGAALTALLFELGRVGIGIYLGNSAVGSAYGTAGALAIILIWVYYSAQILLVGAEFTQVYARWRGAPHLPDKLAVREAQARGAAVQASADRRMQSNAGP
jgi:membrane protein